MTIPPATGLLFRKAVLLWTIGFAATAWLGTGAVNVMQWSPPWVPRGPLSHITHVLPMLPDAWRAIALPAAPPLLIVLALIALAGRPRWWVLAGVWWLYTNLMNTAWLAGSGGQQLMANVLFWNILLASGNTGLRQAAFWIVRLQLLLAYLATGLHKLQGTHWIEGTALGMAATDAAFGPAWVARWPVASHLITWAVLCFQLTFPLAVWWRRTRLPWMCFGIAFHLGTALWMDIPEMGLAFIAVYTSWLGEHDAAAVAGAWSRLRLTPLTAGRRARSRN